MWFYTVCVFYTIISWAPFPPKELLSFTQDFKKPWRVSTKIAQVKTYSLNPKFFPGKKYLLWSRYFWDSPDFLRGGGSVLKHADWWNKLAAVCQPVCDWKPVSFVFYDRSFVKMEQKKGICENWTIAEVLLALESSHPGEVSRLNKQTSKTNKQTNTFFANRLFLMYNWWQINKNNLEKVGCCSGHKHSPNSTRINNQLGQRRQA